MQERDGGANGGNGGGGGIAGQGGFGGNGGVFGTGGGGFGGFGVGGIRGTGGRGIGGNGVGGFGGFFSTGGRGFGGFAGEGPGPGGRGVGGFGGRGLGGRGIGGFGGFGCVPGTIESCTDGVDDDCNGLTDCQDPACFGNRACVVPGQEICNNGLDDDFDGFIDCADSDCATSPACKPTMGAEICDDGVDDNNDGLVDCADPQCVKFPACLTLACRADVDFGTLAARGGDVTRNMDTRSAMASYTTCAPPGGTGLVGSFVLAEAADVRLDFSQASTGAHVVGLFRAGTNQACDQNQVECVSAKAAPTTTHTFAGLAAGTYWLIVESYPGTQSATRVRLSTGVAGAVEICDNGIDDDMNGLIDCQDLSCQSSAICTSSQCTADIVVGALVMDGPSQSVAFDTTNGPDRFRPTCAGASTGGDETISVTIPEAGGILIDYTQTGAHAFGLFFGPGPGQACDNMQRSCVPDNHAAGSIAYSGLAPGRYIFIIKALSPAQAGPVKLRISGFLNRQIENCSNGVDDDGNGLVDCFDPACFGVAGCSASACVPDFDIGPLGPGDSAMLSFDVTTGRDLYQSLCSHGGGKEKVIRFTATQPMGLGINCNETGSQVFQLSQQLAPLDACNAHSVNCADPEVIPFGCNFVMPNLQAGVYNLIVDGFQAGSEGIVNLTLFGDPETITEICNNGIDDDGDGAVDCFDLKCVTSPLCGKFLCGVNQSFGLVPLNGTFLGPLSVQTTGAGDDQTSMCTSGSGGQDAVVDFQLPGTTDLTVRWGQLGRHDFTIFPDGGSLMACDAETPVACLHAADQQTGSQVVSRLPKGKYHLVIDADTAGDEGGVLLQIAGVASP